MAVPAFDGAEGRAQFAEAVQRFRFLHERARAGVAGGSELTAYRAARDNFARMVASVRELSLPPGRPARHALRVRRAVQVDLELWDRKERAIAMDISVGGFSVLLGTALAPGDTGTVSLRLAERARVNAIARVVAVRNGAGTARVSFEFTHLADEDAERLELFVFDALLSELRFEFVSPVTD